VERREGGESGREGGGGATVRYATATGIVRGLCFGTKIYAEIKSQNRHR